MHLMNIHSTSRRVLGSLGTLGCLLSARAHADGMVPDTSVVIVNEADGEASVAVTNTDGKLALLPVTL